MAKKTAAKQTEVAHTDSEKLKAIEAAKLQGWGDIQGVV